MGGRKTTNVSLKRFALSLRHQIKAKRPKYMNITVHFPRRCEKGSLRKAAGYSVQRAALDDPDITPPFARIR
ncbi:hypothetical protein DFP92_106154 [Yoonia sediminilitoris]|uniref:Uncharacterized protein n=1 Tax=Yoonia sediminilitoris TaxID=1286148 RepID=A0A2T6KG74_9RHOB|nr:hypothetical protein C8N45_106154 [Yoonia sediminilitoris]RCW95211.1 hypothetical protein DFP92_106154 [Yoonia sediminilitoris]